jgi:hypothetical protein
MLSVIMLSVTFNAIIFMQMCGSLFCHSAECRSAKHATLLNKVLQTTSIIIETINNKKQITDVQHDKLRGYHFRFDIVS